LIGSLAMLLLKCSQRQEEHAMTRTSLDDAQWASLMMVIQRIPHAWKRHEAALRRFVEAVLWILRTGVPWRDLPRSLGHWPSVYHRWRRWCLRGWSERLFEHLRPALPADGLVLADSTTCKAHRAAAGAAHSTAEAASLGRSRGGIGSKIHACTDRFGRILRLIDSPAQHADLRYARALLADIPAKDVALDRGYVSAKLRTELAARGCTVHTPPKQGMLHAPPWDNAIYAQRHYIENTFSRLKDYARIARRRDKTRHSWMGFVHLAAAMINIRLDRFSHTA
jgi:transposase